MSKFVEDSVEVDGVARFARVALTGSSPGVLDQNRPVPVFLQSYD